MRRFAPLLLPADSWLPGHMPAQLGHRQSTSTGTFTTTNRCTPAATVTSTWSKLSTGRCRCGRSCDSRAKWSTDGRPRARRRSSAAARLAQWGEYAWSTRCPTRIVFGVLRNPQTARGVPGLLEVPDRPRDRGQGPEDRRLDVDVARRGELLGNWGHGGGQLIGECTLYAPYAIRCRDRGAGRMPVSH